RQGPPAGPASTGGMGNGASASSREVLVPSVHAPLFIARQCARHEGFRYHARLLFPEPRDSPIFRTAFANPSRERPMRRKYIGIGIVVMGLMAAGVWIARKPLLARYYVHELEIADTD